MYSLEILTKSQCWVLKGHPPLHERVLGQSSIHLWVIVRSDFSQWHAGRTSPSSAQSCGVKGH